MINSPQSTQRAAEGGDKMHSLSAHLRDLRGESFLYAAQQELRPPSLESNPQSDINNPHSKPSINAQQCKTNGVFERAPRELITGVFGRSQNNNRRHHHDLQQLPLKKAPEFSSATPSFGAPSQPASATHVLIAPP